jgi:hypothetical protein
MTPFIHEVAKAKAKANSKCNSNSKSKCGDSSPSAALRVRMTTVGEGTEVVMVYGGPWALVSLRIA